MADTKVYRIELSVGGDIIREFVHLSLNQSFTDHHRLEIHIPSFVFTNDNPTGFIDVRDITARYVGENTDFLLKEGNTDSQNNFREETKLTFKGLVSGIQLQKVDAINSVIIFSVLSPTILLDTGENTASFIEQSLSGIVDKILRSADGRLPSLVSPVFSPAIPYITQYREDNFHFIQRLANSFGEWCYYDGARFIFGKAKAGQAMPLELEYGGNLTQLEYTLHLVPTTSAAVCYDYLTNKKYDASASAERVDGLQDHPRQVLSKSEKIFAADTIDISFQGYQSADTLKDAIKLAKSESSNKLAICKGISRQLQLSVGNIIRIKDDVIENGRKLRTDDYGTFLVTSVRHFVDARGFYQNTFEAIPQDADYPPVDYRVFQPKAESQPAKVVDTNDPDKMGRVKVRFYWQEDGESTPWIRVASLMSAADQGVYFIPEVDQVVFVDFEFGNPDLPFVRGAMYTGGALPGSKLFEPQNNFKGIVTRAGNHIIIDDKKGAEEIRIYNADNQNEITLSLSGDPHIQVKSKGKITLEGEEIELKAKSISMKADQDWKAEAQTVAIKAAQDLKAEAGNVKVEGKTQASLKGANILELQGGSQAILKGAQVMIN